MRHIGYPRSAGRFAGSGSTRLTTSARTPTGVPAVSAPLWEFENDLRNIYSVSVSLIEVIAESPLPRQDRSGGMLEKIMADVPNYRVGLMRMSAGIRWLR
jgi:hypothetical protein